MKVNEIVEWLRKKVEDSHTKGLVVGLSGGIDSAVVGFLIKKAFPENSLGVILPCKSSGKDRVDAIKTAEKAGLKYTEIDLTDVHELLYQKSMKAIGRDVNNRMTDANLRARLRMSTIYSIANELNYLVVGTDNKAELYTGYFTKYGDGGVDILPISDLTKREVYDLARELGVPSEVIKRDPSAGLWEGQTDEKEMGITYNAIDDFLDGKEIDEADKKRLLQMHQRTEHKRRSPYRIDELE